MCPSVSLATYLCFFGEDFVYIHIHVFPFSSHSLCYHTQPFVHLVGTYGVYQALGHSKLLMKLMVKPFYIDMEVHGWTIHLVTGTSV